MPSSVGRKLKGAFNTNHQHTYSISYHTYHRAIYHFGASCKNISCLQKWNLLNWTSSAESMSRFSPWAHACFLLQSDAVSFEIIHGAAFSKVCSYHNLDYQSDQDFWKKTALWRVPLNTPQAKCPLAPVFIEGRQKRGKLCSGYMQVTFRRFIWLEDTFSDISTVWKAVLKKAVVALTREGF